MGEGSSEASAPGMSGAPPEHEAPKLCADHGGDSRKTSLWCEIRARGERAKVS